MPRAKQDPQDRAIKVLVALIRSHQGLLGQLKEYSPPHAPINLSAAERAVDGVGKLLNDLRLGEVKVTAWEPVTTMWCVECGNNWENETGSEDDCPECGGQGSDA